MLRKVSAILAIAGMSVLAGATVLPTSVLQGTPLGTSYSYSGYGLTMSSSVTFTGYTWPPGYEQWNGLWISQNETANMKFVFDTPVSNLHIKFTALTYFVEPTGLIDEEWWDSFVADGTPVSITLADNNVFGHECVWDSGAVKPLVNDGWGTVVYSPAVTTFEFLHDTTQGQPNGAVITEMSWDPVPEPATMACLAAGGIMLLRFRRASRS